MDKLLSLILSIFTDSDSLKALIAKLLEALLRGVDDPDGCKDRLLEWVQTGTLDDKFREDPIGTFLCVAHVLLELADQWHDHEDDDDSAAIVFADPYVTQLADALEIPTPAGGPLLNALIALIAQKLLEWLKDQLQD